MILLSIIMASRTEFLTVPGLDFPAPVLESHDDTNIPIQFLRRADHACAGEVVGKTQIASHFQVRSDDDNRPHAQNIRQSPRSQLVDWIGRYAPSADIKQCLDQASNLSNQFANGTTAEQRTILQSLLDTTTLGSEAIDFKLKASELVTKLTGQVADVDIDHDDNEHPDPLITIKLPVSIKRRGNEMRLMIQGEGQHRVPDPQLVSLIARAHLYLQHLTRAPNISVSDVADQFGVHRVDVGRILPLAFLAPKVVDQILTGNQSDDMSARRLARAELPLLWSEQTF